MLKAVIKATDLPDREQRIGQIRPLYLKTVNLVERLHRRLLDVIKDEFDRRGRADINACQAFLLYNIGEQELSVGELRARGYYLGTNVSYNLKRLIGAGFIDHQRPFHAAWAIRKARHRHQDARGHQGGGRKPRGVGAHRVGD